MSETFDKRRIVKNSATLYVRMIFTMVLNLLTTRFVLSNLGVEDMGVYGVVGSIVTMFAILVSGLLSATQRFITFELGKKDGNLPLVFNTSTNLILCVSIGLFLIMEAGGSWMLHYHINIPERSMEAAQWVLQFSIFTSLLNLNSTAYSALLIAYERMNVWAVISIVQVLLGCVAAYSLSCFPQDSRLFWNALMLLGVQCVVQCLYIGYCKFHFPESRFRWGLDKKIVRSMAKYTGASSVNGVLYIVFSQGLVLVINWTYGVAVNAVYNIGMQVKNSVLSFGLNIYKAVQPQITKTYASGEYDKHEKLVYSGSKIGAYMIMLILLPFCLHTDFIMRLWLGNVPPYASVFAAAFVFQSLMYASFEPFRTAVLATGNVTKFFIYSEVVHLGVLPLAYWAGKTYDTPVVLVVTIVVWEFVYCGYMAWIGTRVSKIRLRGLFCQVLVPCMEVGCFSAIVYYVLAQLMPESLIYVLLQMVIGSACLFLIALLIGTNTQERRLLRQVWEVVVTRVINKKCL